MPRASTATEKLEKIRSMLGTQPDHVIADAAGVSRGAVGKFRRDNGIPAYDGYKFGLGQEPPATRRKREAAGQSAPAQSRSGGARRGRRSVLDGWAHLIGTVTDREIAEKAGLTVAAVRKYRIRYGIGGTGRGAQRAPAAASGGNGALASPARRRTSKLDPIMHLIGMVSDKEIAERAGVTTENVRQYRRRHDIPAQWRDEAAAPSAATPAATPAAAPASGRGRKRRIAATAAAAASGSQGYTVEVAVGGSTHSYFIVASDIAAAAASAARAMGARHPSGRIAAIRYAGASL